MKFSNDHDLSCACSLLDAFLHELINTKLSAGLFCRTFPFEDIPADLALLRDADDAGDDETLIRLLLKYAKAYTLSRDISPFM